MKRIWEALWRPYEKLPVNEKKKDLPSSKAAMAGFHFTGSLAGSNNVERWMRAEISVKGMTCAACSTSVESTLGSCKGVRKAAVALLQETAEVEYDATLVKPQHLVTAIEDAGFDAALVREAPVLAPLSINGGRVNTMPANSKQVSTLHVDHMTADSTCEEVRRCVAALPGVHAVTANPGGMVQITHQMDMPTQVRVLRELEDGGFSTRVVLWGQPAAQGEAEAGNPTQVVQLSVHGMTCAACSTAVERALMGVRGVSRACVALTQARAEVEYDATITNTNVLIEVVDDAGFEVALVAKQPQGAVQLAEIKIEGMTCGACTTAVERCLLAVEGVSSVTASLITASAQVWFDGNVTGPRHMITSVEDAGFGATYLPPGMEDGKNGAHTAALAAAQEVAYWWSLFSASLWFTVPVFFVAMVLPRIPGSAHITGTLIFGFPCNQLVKWVLTTPVQFVIGWRFHRGAAKALRRGTANMDVLVSLGTNASYFYSVISIMHHRFSHHFATQAYVPTDFFETSAMLITLLLLGKYLEASAKGRTSDALTKLLRLTPDVATVVELDEDGGVVSSQEVPSSLIHKGDLIKVLPGAKIPADGVIVQGDSFLNEVMITGESIPAHKGPGDPVTGGTVNNGNAIVLQALRVGTETTLAQIVKLVEKAQMSKAPVQAVADRISAKFVPVVIILSLITWLTWYTVGRAGGVPAGWMPEGHTPFLFALLFGISVLVIACPCALGLATPTAVMVGTGVAATQGILIKGADRLEAASKVDVVVFDKTGTLTRGRPVVTDVLQAPSSGMTLRQLASLLGSAESESEHPLAHAVLEWCLAQYGLAVEGSNRGGLKPFHTPRALPASPARSFRRSSFVDGGASPKDLPAQMGPRRLTGTGGGAAVANTARSVFAKAQSVVVLPGAGISCRVPAHQHASGSPGPVAMAASSHGGGPAISTPQPLHPTNSAAVATSPTSPQAAQLCTVVIGNDALMQRVGVVVPPELAAQITPYEDCGHTCVYAAVDGQLSAVLCVCDPLKPEAPSVIAALEARKIHCYMVTGDNVRTANAVAAQLGLTSVFAQVLPAGKAEKVRELQAAGHQVAMVGDGINDSPALAASDLGVAIGSGTDIAMEAAHYVLMRDDLATVVTALDLSRVTLNRIWINYVWAMMYNIMMIPVAAGVLYPATRVQMPPWVAGSCMAFSSVSVIMSSLALRRYRAPVLPAAKPRSRAGQRSEEAEEEGVDGVFGETELTPLVNGSAESFALPRSSSAGLHQHQIPIGSLLNGVWKKHRPSRSPLASRGGAAANGNVTTTAASSSMFPGLVAQTVPVDGDVEQGLLEEMDDDDMAMLRIGRKPTKLGRHERERAERQALISNKIK